MYKLSQDKNGLHCAENGLTYGGIPLVARVANNRFAPCRVNSLRKAGLSLSQGGVQAVANALNKGDLPLAMIAAVHLRMPPLKGEVAAKLAKAGYSPDEPQDNQGRWTANNGATTAARHHAGVQVADSGEIMSDASPAGRADALSVSQTGKSGLDIDKAIERLNVHANENQGSIRQCAPYVEDALAYGGLICQGPWN